MGLLGTRQGNPIPTLKQILDGAKPANSEAIVVETIPGNAFRYSGGGYVIVQRAMMDVTGKDFPEIMKENVLEPAGMKSSTYDPQLKPALLTGIAMPVDEQGKPLPEGPHIYPELGAARLWTTPSDLARWIIAMQASLAGRSGGFLSPTEAQTMVTPIKQGYGLGVTVQTMDGSLSFSHTGSNAGYKTMYLSYGAGDGAVVMTNAENGFALIGEVVPTLACIYNWTAFKPERRAFVDMPLREQQKFIGSFAAQNAYGFEITLAGNHLQFSIEGDTPAALLTSSATSFFETENTAQLSFDTPDRGKLLIGHQTFPFTRVNTPKKPIEH